MCSSSLAFFVNVFVHSSGACVHANRPGPDEEVGVDGVERARPLPFATLDAATASASTTWRGGSSSSSSCLGLRDGVLRVGVVRAGGEVDEDGVGYAASAEDSVVRDEDACAFCWSGEGGCSCMRWVGMSTAVAMVARIGWWVLRGEFREGGNGELDSLRFLELVPP